MLIQLVPGEEHGALGARSLQLFSQAPQELTTVCTKCLIPRGLKAGEVLRRSVRASSTALWAFLCSSSLSTRKAPALFMSPLAGHGIGTIEPDLQESSTAVRNRGMSQLPQAGLEEPINAPSTWRMSRTQPMRPSASMGPALPASGPGPECDVPALRAAFPPAPVLGASRWPLQRVHGPLIQPLPQHQAQRGGRASSWL